jgi:hypothetical protein
VIPERTSGPVIGVDLPGHGSSTAIVRIV